MPDRPDSMKDLAGSTTALPSFVIEYSDVIGHVSFTHRITIGHNSKKNLFEKNGNKIPI